MLVSSNAIRVYEDVDAFFGTSAEQDQDMVKIRQISIKVHANQVNYFMSTLLEGAGVYALTWCKKYQKTSCLISINEYKI